MALHLSVLYILSLKMEHLTHHLSNETPKKTTTAPVSARLLPEEGIISRLFRYIEQHLSRKLTVAQLASMLHISPRHLHRLCIQYSGKNPKRHIDEALLKRACRLLQKPKVLIQSVALHLGFENVSHFCRFFKSMTGYPPSAHRLSGSGI